MSRANGTTPHRDLSREEAIERIEELERRINEFGNVLSTLQHRLDQTPDAGRLDALEQRVAELEPTGPEDGKDGKVAAVVQYAHNRYDGTGVGVLVKAEEIEGAVGCSTRYAYDLIDEIGTTYAWAVRNQDRDDGRTDAPRGVLVRFNADDRPTVPLNKFNNSSGGEGA
jgi:hypothetical protein